MVAHSHKPIRRAFSSNLPNVPLFALLVCIVATIAAAAPGEVLYGQKISSVTGGFTGALDDSDQFGYAVCALGDVDGDGISDLAVGAPFDDDGGTDRGAVWVLFMNADATVRASQKIGALSGNFSGALDDNDLFGVALCSTGDLDGDGIPDLAAGAMNDDDGGADLGAVWLLFLNADGTVKSHQKISALSGGFSGGLGFLDNFGNALTALGDLNGDGFVDLAAGALNDDDGGTNRGAVWVLFLNADGTVSSTQKISDTEGNFAADLVNFDTFGTSVTGVGDLNMDGVPDLAVGAIGDDDGGAQRGAVWMLFLNADGTVKSYQKISNTQGGFTATLDNSDWFGISVAGIGDLDNDGIQDITVGAYGDDDGGSTFGAAYTLFLNGDGTVHDHQKISALESGFAGTLRAGDRFGNAVAAVGDLDGDHMPEVAVGAYFDDDGGPSRGAVWILSVEAVVVDLDTDGDGLTDTEETDVYGTDPANADTDGDGLSDGDEVLIDGTDPLNPDSDNGGVNDGTEVLVDGTDPLDPKDDLIDSDGDGLLDGVERDLAKQDGCLDPFNPDSDGDGLSDGDEILAIGTSVCDPDTDGDGIQDGEDPDPLNPETLATVVAAKIRETAAAMASLPLDLVETKNARCAAYRIQSMAESLYSAANHVDADRYKSATGKLVEVYQRLDGRSNPADWIKASDMKSSLVAELQDEMALLAQLTDPRPHGCHGNGHHGHHSNGHSNHGHGKGNNRNDWNGRDKSYGKDTNRGNHCRGR
ncbi:MAG: hypothetical protein AMXMBFR82_21610 [Candidatus Hydrogenedentota bacterium]